jgi:hypothetical protein
MGAIFLNTVNLSFLKRYRAQKFEIVFQAIIKKRIPF